MLNIAAAKALAILEDTQAIYIRGYTTAGDGGGGMYIYDASSAATANDGTVLALDTLAGRLLHGETTDVTVETFGAVGDGVTDDSAAAQAYMDSFLVVDFTKGKSYVLNEALFTRTGSELRGNGSELLSLSQRVVGGKEVPFIGILGGNNIKIHGFTFRMSTPSLAFSGYAIEAALSNSSITDITGADRTTADTESDGIHVYNNRFIGIGNYQLIAQGGLHSDIRFFGNNSLGCIRGVALGRSESGSGKAVIVKDNNFIFKEIAGVQTTPIPVALKVDGFYSGVEVSDNYIETTLSNSSTGGVPALQFECEVIESFITDNIITGSGNDGGIWLTVGQVDSVNTKQGPCRKIKVTGNIINCTGLGIFYRNVQVYKHSE